MVGRSDQVGVAQVYKDHTDPYPLDIPLGLGSWDLGATQTETSF